MKKDEEAVEREEEEEEEDKEEDKEEDADSRTSLIVVLRSEAVQRFSFAVSLSREPLFSFRLFAPSFVFSRSSRSLSVRECTFFFWWGSFSG